MQDNNEFLPAADGEGAQRDFFLVTADPRQARVALAVASVRQREIGSGVEEYDQGYVQGVLQSEFRMLVEDRRFPEHEDGRRR